MTEQKFPIAAEGPPSTQTDAPLPPEAEGHAQQGGTIDPKEAKNTAKQLERLERDTPKKAEALEAAEAKLREVAGTTTTAEAEQAQRTKAVSDAVAAADRARSELAQAKAEQARLLRVRAQQLEEEARALGFADSRTEGERNRAAVEDNDLGYYDAEPWAGQRRVTCIGCGFTEVGDTAEDVVQRHIRAAHFDLAARMDGALQRAAAGK